MISSQNIIRMTLADKNLTLIGTAHVSRQSAQLVRQIIETEKPDTVAVELCEARYRSLTQGRPHQNFNLFAGLKKKEAVFLIVQRILGYLQHKIGARLNVNPGEEMLQAIQAAHEVELGSIWQIGTSALLSAGPGIL